LGSHAGTCTGCSKKTDPLGYFDDNFGKYGPILIIFSLLQREIHDAQKIKLFQPPHLYYDATLPSETNTDAGISAVCFNELNGPQSDLKSN